MLALISLKSPMNEEGQFISNHEQTLKITGKNLRSSYQLSGALCSSNQRKSVHF
jgi:hypothetical protein